MNKMVYMDYNATAPLHASVIEAMGDALRHVGNPSSVHLLGREARARMEDAREAVAKLINAPADWVIFTSGGTEADVLALNGVGRKYVLASAVEHAAVLNGAEHVQEIPVDGNGLIDLALLEEALKGKEGEAIVSVMAANNETGVIQPIAKVVEIAHAYGALVHCDAVQAVGKIAFDMQALGCDLVSLSAHKIGGASGVGALVKADHVRLEALHKGGGQEQSLRGGTENLSGIVGFGAAAQEKLDVAKIRNLRDELEARVIELGATVFGKDVDRLPNTSCFALEGLNSERQVMALDLAGIMVSAGSACSSGKVKASHVLKAMKVDEELAGCAIRVSLGWDSTKEDVEKFVQTWSKLVERVRLRKSGRSNAA